MSYLSPVSGLSRVVRRASTSKRFIFTFNAYDANHNPTSTTNTTSSTDTNATNGTFSCGTKGRKRFRKLHSNIPRGIVPLTQQRVLSQETTNQNIASLFVQQQQQQQQRSFASTAGSSSSSKDADTNTNMMSVPETVEPMERFRLYRYLKLQTFSKQEMEDVYDQISTTSVLLDYKDVTNYLLQRLQEIEQEEDKVETSAEQSSAALPGSTLISNDSNSDNNYNFAPERFRYAQYEARKFLEYFKVHDPSTADPNQQPAPNGIAKDQFVQIITEQATAVDMRKMAPITMSILLVGTSVGIVTPAMPFVVNAIGLSPGQYGTVVSAFALAKMTGNIPSAILVERYGRKPFLTWSLAVIALGVGGIGAAGSFEELYLCRLLTGAGVAALTTGSQLMVTDVSTPLNRATTMSPIVSAFAAGTALGPAIGGALVDILGLQSTFFLVGSSYLGVCGLNSYILEETKHKPFFLPQWADMESSRFPHDYYEPTGKNSSHTNLKRDQVSLGVATKTALAQWAPLFQKPKIRNIMIMNGFYWFSLAGSQMTLLPLLLTNSASGLELTASGVGQVYMLMSVVQVLSNPFMARYLVDSIGKVPAIAGGCGVIASSMTILPLCTDNWPLFVGTLGFWALGSSMLSTAPLAYISDSVDEDQRAQAIAMLRTSGDVGFLFGSSCVGALADMSGSIEVAMQSSGGFLSAATFWFIVRQTMLHNASAPPKKVSSGQNEDAQKK